MDDRKVIIRNKVLFYRQKAPYVRSGESILGALEYDSAKDCIRCHECGLWFKSVAAHLKHEHGITAREYKQRHGLRQSTALISEGVRQNMVKTQSQRESNHEHLRVIREKQAQNDGPKVPKTPIQPWSIETRNMDSTCHAQMLEKLKALTDRLGRSPNLNDLRRAGIWEYSLCMAFNVDSVRDVYSLLKMAQPADRKPRRQYTPEVLLELLRDFFVKHERLPSRSDFFRRLIPSANIYHRAFGSFEAACTEAGLAGVYENQKQQRAPMMPTKHSNRPVDRLTHLHLNNARSA